MTLSQTLRHPPTPATARRCARCVMDTTDPEITFDAQGVCSHCRRFDAELRPKWRPTAEGARQLEARVAGIKAEGRGRDYDCIIGLSGGVDSSFLAMKVKDLGLRPLVVHVDGGWNSELAVGNIENLVKALGFDLFTLVIDWEEMRDLQVAFLRAGVPNQDVPQDHAIFAGLYRFATKEKIRWVLSGGNLATEGILPTAWGYDAMDVRQLRAIHRRFGRRPLATFPTVSFFNLHFGYPLIRRMKVLRPLDLMPYSKAAAMAELSARYGWRYYGAKHHESVWTKFFQSYYLPARFGYDKRLAHLSSLIVTGQLTRDAALHELAEPAYPPDELRRDREFVLKKLGITEAEFELLMRQPPRTHRDYPSNEKANALAGAAVHAVITAARRLRPRKNGS
ncbi:MAG TPA: N-acetyl sugar amidotransferase [Opitutaceae bacterium]|nr:N-acetyl sugar amidotransferase [Opitutaceae bacterium]